MPENCLMFSAMCLFVYGVFPVFHCMYLFKQVTYKAETWFCFLDFKLSPCSECCLFSFGWFPGVWFIYADVSEHSICSIFKSRCEDAFEDGTDRVFRNVGIYKSEAGESPKRKQTMWFCLFCEDKRGLILMMFPEKCD